MRWFAVVLSIVFTAVLATAQITVAPAPIPIAYGFSNSVIDHNGRVLVFDASYTYPPIMTVQPVASPIRFPPIVQTHVTVIESNASSKQDAHYDGAFQILGVGRYAVYAIITKYAIAAPPPQGPVSVTRQLVAIGPAFPTLPSIDVPSQTDVKISAVGDDGTPDTIAFVPIVITPLVAAAAGTATGIIQPVPPIPTPARTVQMYQFNGTTFTALPPVTISNP
jgi:hypothetical protein